MNKRILSLCLASSLFAACASTTVQVIDKHSNLPVACATVTAVNGNVYSPAVLTNVYGEAVAPTLPIGVKALVIKKPGYDTKRVEVSP